MILVAGAIHHDLMLDVPRLPREDETLPGGAPRWLLGGKGANQAVAVARAGAAVALAGAVGDDASGVAMRAALARAGVGLDALQVVGQPTGMSVALTLPGGGYGAVIATGANAAFDPARVVWDGVTHLVLQGELPPATNAALAAAATARGIPVILNAAPAREADRALLPHLGLIVVNRVEAFDLTGDGAPEAAAATLVEAGAKAAIVTLGADGLVLADPEPVSYPAPRVTVASSHGAGDAFLGALVAALAAGTPLPDATAAAQTAAARHVATPLADRPA